MAKLNNVRFLNVKYNKRELIDETISLNGEHTLSLLENGGGKTVLNKFVASTFLWGYKKASKKDIYSIDDFFKTEKGPCYICSELILDNGEYLLVIVSIVKNSETDDIVKRVFCAKYSSFDYKYSLKNFPLKNEKGQLRHPAELQKSLRNEDVEIFGTNIEKGYKAFKEYMLENHIFVDFYEDVIVPVLSSEGGLSNLFGRYNTFNKFLKDFLMPIVTKKGSGEDSSKKLAENLAEHAIRIKGHQDKIKEKEDKQLIREPISDLLNEVLKKEELENKDIALNFLLEGILSRVDAKIEKDKKDEVLINKEKHNLENRIKDIEKCIICKKILILQKKIDEIEQVLIKNNNDIANKQAEIESLRKLKIYHDAYKAYRDFEIAKSELERQRIKMQPFEEKQKELNNKLIECGKKIYSYYLQQKKIIDNTLYLKEEQKKSNLKDFKNLESLRQSKEKEKEEIVIAIKECDLLFINFKKNIDELNIKYPDLNLEFNDEVFSFNEKIKEIKKDIEKELLKIEEEYNLILKALAANEADKINTYNLLNTLKNEKEKAERELLIIEKEKEVFENSFRRINEELEKVNPEFLSVDNFENILIRVGNEIEKLSLDIASDTIKINNLINRKNAISEQSLVDEQLINILKKHNIYFENGLNYLHCYSENIAVREDLYSRLPIIIYSIVMSGSEYNRLKKILSEENFSKFVTPILIKEKLDKVCLEQNNMVVNLSDMGLCANFPKEAYDKNYIKIVEEKINEELIKTKNQKAKRENQNKRLINLEQLLIDFIRLYSSRDQAYFDRVYNDYQNKCNDLKNKYDETEKKYHSFFELDNNLNNSKNSLDFKKKELIDKKEAIIILNGIKDYSTKKKEKEDLRDKKKKVDSFISQIIRDQERKKNDIMNLTEDIANLSNQQNLIKNKLFSYKEYEGEDFLVTEDIGVLEDNFEQIKRDIFSKNSVYEDFEKINKLYMEKEKYFLKYSHINSKEYINKDWENFEPVEVEKRIILINTEVQNLSKKQGKLEKEKEDKQSEQIKLNKELKNKGQEFQEVKIDSDFEADRDALLVRLKEYSQKLTEIQNSIKALSSFYKNRNKMIKGLKIIPDLDFKEELEKRKLPMLTFDNYEDLFDSVFELLNINTMYLGEQKQKIKNKIRKIFKTVKSDSCVSGVVEKIRNADDDNVLTSKNLNQTLKQIDDSILVLNEELRLIKENEAMVEQSFIDYAQMLLDSLRKFGKICGKMNLDSNHQKLIEVSKINSIEPSENALKEYIHEKVTSCLSMDEIGIRNYLKDNISSYDILSKYININELNLIFYKKDKNEFQKITYADFIANKLSGAQKMLISLILFESVYLFISDDGTNRKYSNFLVQDNPFGAITTSEYIDVLFEFVNKYNLQLWSWTDVKEPHIIQLHNRIYCFSIQKYKDKEYLEAKETGISEQTKIYSLEQNTK